MWTASYCEVLLSVRRSSPVVYRIYISLHYIMVENLSSLSSEIDCLMLAEGNGQEVYGGEG